jgi:hypothetical protein
MRSLLRGASVSGRLLAFLLAAIPSLGAFAGGWLDERLHLGFTNWRSACRASGLSARSLLHFTLELLPLAVAGMLLGGVVLLSLGIFLRLRPNVARVCTAAHLGCAFVMPLSLILCATTLPLGVMFAIDLALAAGVAAFVLRDLPRRVTCVATHP